MANLMLIVWVQKMSRVIRPADCEHSGARAGVREKKAEQHGVGWLPLDRSHAAQLKLMLRQQEDLDVVLLLVAWYVWRERVAWLQTSLWWKHTSGRLGFLQEVLQHWREAVPLKRQERQAMDRVAEKEALQNKDVQTLSRKVFHTWQQCAATAKHQNLEQLRRARLCAIVARPHHVRMARRALGAWQQEALENRERRGAARLFLKFKLLHQGR
eukprot:s1038_g7.t1